MSVSQLKSASAIVLSLLTGLAGVAAIGAESAKNEKPGYPIIQAAQATPAERFAARELSGFLQKVTGATFEVREETDKPLPAKAIHVGWTDFARRHADLAALGPEEWFIKTAGNNLIVAGGRPRGTLYAVYEYLEQELRCHWLDEFTEVIPSQPTLKFATLDIKGKPAFWNRVIYSGPPMCDPDLMYRFDIRNKDSKATPYGFTEAIYGAPNTCHTFYDYSKDWPAAHPEYLAMDDKGQRVVSTSGLGPGQICLTHPDVRKLMLAKLRKYIVTDREAAARGGYPAPRIYSIEQNDNPSSCRCPECKAFSEREGSDSGPLLDLVNDLADGIRVEFPDVMIGTFAYMQTLIPPKTVKPRDNVIIRVAQLNAEYTGSESSSLYPDYFRPMSSKINRPVYENLAQWAKIARHIGIWDYWILYDFNGADRFMTPYANVSCIAPDIRLFFDNHAETLFVECEKPEDTSFFALKRWLGLKLMQDPLRPREQLVKTFMAGYYGPAARKIAEYLDYMEQRIDAVPQEVKMSSMLEQHRPYLDVAFYSTGIQLLDEAEKLCGSNKAARLHVRREKIPVYSGLLGAWKYLKNTPAGKVMPFDRDAIINSYETVCREQIEAFYARGKQTAAKKKLEEQLEKYRNSMRGRADLKGVLPKS
ncbi:MAG: DUF4838 domain-containing protein [Verrucomicrobiia bacterium]